MKRTLEACSYPGSRKPRPLAVDECANFWPGCPEFRRGMSPRLGVSQVPRPLPVGLHNWDKTPSLSCLCPLNYLKRTSHTEGFYNVPIRKCVLFHERPRLRFFDEKEFDLQVDDRTSASGGWGKWWRLWYLLGRRQNLIPGQINRGPPPPRFFHNGQLLLPQDGI